MIRALLNHRGDGNKAELAVHFVAKWIGQGHPGIAKLPARTKLVAFGCGLTVTGPLSVLSMTASRSGLAGDRGCL